MSRLVTLRSLVFVGLLAFLVLPSLVVAAPPPGADHAVDAQLKAVIAEMRADPSFWSLDAANPPDARVKGYELYALDLMALKTSPDGPRAFANALRSTGWEYPLVDKRGHAVNAVQVTSDGDDYQVAGQGLWIPAALLDLSADPKAISNLLTDGGATDVREIRHVRSEGLHCDFIYALAGNGEYVIPLSSDASPLGLVSRKVYPATAAVSAVLGSLPAEVAGTAGDLVLRGPSARTLETRSIAHRPIPRH